MGVWVLWLGMGMAWVAELLQVWHLWHHTIHYQSPEDAADEETGAAPRTPGRASHPAPRPPHALQAPHDPQASDAR
jgi:hypothetical protein